MSSLHRVLERLDGAASTLVPLAYLIGLTLGTLAYFADVRLGFIVAVGIALALAAELHSFLEQRRCRALWATYSHLQADDEQRRHVRTQLRAHMAILAALVTFSAFNSVAFVASTWTPAPGWLPSWIQIGIRGAIVPALFLLAGFLSPLHVDAGDELRAAARDMLNRTLRATVRQWRERIDRARRSGVDLAPVAVALLADAGDTDGARRVALIAEGLDAAEHPHARRLTGPTEGLAGRSPINTLAALSAPASASTDAQAGAPNVPERPPTGPGTPAASKGRRGGRVQTPRRHKAPPMLRITPGTAEERIRAVLHATPEASIKQIAERAGVSSATASKWRQVIRGEGRDGARVEQQQLAR